MPGLDPGIHRSLQEVFSKKMDCRVKPGDDGELGDRCLTFESVAIREGEGTTIGRPRESEDPYAAASRFGSSG
jgi:hypothetical protein